jgi:transcription antitermination factor NusG
MTSTISTPRHPPGSANPVTHWYACRTRARAEKQVCRFLERVGVESYLPLVELERKWADRTKRVGFPLFPGYTFARFPVKNLLEVVQTPGLVTVVSENGLPAPIREVEMESVRRFVMGVEGRGETPAPEDWWEPGTQILVRQGPFRGMRGYLLESRGKRRVAVKLDALKMAFSVEMDLEEVERVA